jgi:hypothetical protein
VQKLTTELPAIRMPGSDMGRYNNLLGLGYGLSVARGLPTESGYGGSDTHNIALPAGTRKFTLEMSETDEGLAVEGLEHSEQALRDKLDKVQKKAEDRHLHAQVEGQVREVEETESELKASNTDSGCYHPI